MAAVTSPRHLDASHYCAKRHYHRIDQPTPPPSGLEHHRHCATVTAHKKEVSPSPTVHHGALSPFEFDLSIALPSLRLLLACKPRMPSSPSKLSLVSSVSQRRSLEEDHKKNPT
jgi:hypothetical protein